MRNYRTVAIVLILVGLLSVPAQAQVIPGRWEKVAALKLGPPYTRALGHQKISFFIASLTTFPKIPPIASAAMPPAFSMRFLKRTAAT